MEEEEEQGEQEEKKEVEGEEGHSDEQRKHGNVRIATSHSLLL